MSDVSFCPDCHAMLFAWSKSRHQCSPFFIVKDEDTDDESRVRATDHEDAAEKWAERADCDSAEYAIVNGRHKPIVVVTDVHGVSKRMRVSGETQAVYSAEEIDTDCAV